MRISICRKNAGRIRMILVSEAKNDSEEPILRCNLRKSGLGFEIMDDAEDAIPESDSGATVL